MPLAPLGSAGPSFVEASAGLSRARVERDAATGLTVHLDEYQPTLQAPVQDGNLDSLRVGVEALCAAETVRMRQELQALGTEITMQLSDDGDRAAISGAHRFAEKRTWTLDDNALRVDGSTTRTRMQLDAAAGMSEASLVQQAIGATIRGREAALRSVYTEIFADLLVFSEPSSPKPDAGATLPPVVQTDKLSATQPGE